MTQIFQIKGDNKGRDFYAKVSSLKFYEDLLRSKQLTNQGRNKKLKGYKIESRK
jgi:hypothetical protein